jgi:hypothetical protein
MRVGHSLNWQLVRDVAPCMGLGADLYRIRRDGGDDALNSRLGRTAAVRAHIHDVAPCDRVSRQRPWPAR